MAPGTRFNTLVERKGLGADKTTRNSLWGHEWPLNTLGTNGMETPGELFSIQSVPAVILTRLCLEERRRIVQEYRILCATTYAAYSTFNLFLGGKTLRHIPCSAGLGDIGITRR